MGNAESHIQDQGYKTSAVLGIVSRKTGEARVMESIVLATGYKLGLDGAIVIN